MVAWMNDEHPFLLFFKVKNTATYCNFILTAIATDLLLWMTMEKRRKCLIVQIVAEDHMCSVGSTFVLKNKGTEDICLVPPKNKLSWVNTTYICNSRIKQAYFFQKLTQFLKSYKWISQKHFVRNNCSTKVSFLKLSNKTCGRLFVFSVYLVTTYGRQLDNYFGTTFWIQNLRRWILFSVKSFQKGIMFDLKVFGDISIFVLHAPA